MTTREFSVTISAPPDQEVTHQLALRFVRAALSEGHSVRQIFFYKDATRLPADSGSAGLADAWRTLSDAGARFPLYVCVAAAERRGLHEVNAPWQLVGLGDWVEGLDSDRHLHFGGSQ